MLKPKLKIGFGSWIRTNVIAVKVQCPTTRRPRNWYSVRGLNSRPSLCKSDVLPAELTEHK